MTDAREIIASTYIEGRTEPVGPLHAQAILAALTAAGFRIVGPGEVDKETVETCAEVADAEVAKHQGPFTSQPAYVASCAIRDALRALKEEQS